MTGSGGRAKKDNKGQGTRNSIFMHPTSGKTQEKESGMSSSPRLNVYLVDNEKV
jgi:hypothetical protein